MQVFENESHASIHSTKTKEGLSLFGPRPSPTYYCIWVDEIRLGTLDSTRTTLGRSLLRTWLLRPSLSLEVINARHNAVECFTRPENLDIANIMHGQLGGIKNIPRIISALKAGRANLANWQGLVKVRAELEEGVAVSSHYKRPGLLSSSLSTLRCFVTSSGNSAWPETSTSSKRYLSYIRAFSVQELIPRPADHRFGYRGLQRSR